MKQWLGMIIVVLFLIAFTACSKTEDSKSEPSNDKNPATEAVNMIANDEKIIEMLKKKGEIPEDASQDEIAEALQKYLKDKTPGPGSLKDEKEKQNYINKLKEEIQKSNKD
jgi:bacillopeptidase F (M6 metalloprotease family)